MAYINDSDEEHEEDEDMLLACILLVSEYLEEKEERPKFMLERELPGNITLQS